MSEPPYKRSRRDDGQDSRHARNQRTPRNHNDRKGDRVGSSRSRSPVRRDRDRGYGRDREERRDRDAGRSGGREDTRDSTRGLDRRGDRRHGDKNGNKDEERERKRYPADRGSREEARGAKRGRDEDVKARSRSPKEDRSPNRDAKEPIDGFERASTQGLPHRDRNQSRQTTPPLTFALNRSRGPSLDRDPATDPAIKKGDLAQPHTQHKKTKNRPKAAEFIGDLMDEDEEDDGIVVEEDDSMAAMQAMMGFGGFGTTKQKKIPGNDVYAVRKEKKTEYRQYMNRVGGFNRPLDEA